MKPLVILRVVVCGLLLVAITPVGKVRAATGSRTVKIGVLASLTGSGFSLGRNTVAALRIAAADLQNIHPQYNPVQYRFLVRDTQQDPSRALNAIQDLHARGVKIIIGPQTSSEVAMIKPFADAHDILVISQGSTASSLAIPGDNILRFCPNDRREAEALVALLQHDGIRAIVPLWRNRPPLTSQPPAASNETDNSTHLILSMDRQYEAPIHDPGKCGFAAPAALPCKKPKGRQSFHTHSLFL